MRNMYGEKIMKILKTTLFKTLLLFIFNMSICYSYEINNGTEGFEFTKISKVVVFVYPFKTSYPIRGELSDQVEYLKVNSGLKITIDSIYQILELEQELKLNKFIKIDNYNKFIKNFETYAVFVIKVKSETIELAYDGEYLMNVTNKTYRKLKNASLFNFDPFKAHRSKEKQELN